MTFEPSYSDGSVTSRGQISTIHVIGDAESKENIETTLSETLIISVLAMAVLDDAASQEQLVTALGEAYAGMLAGIPETVPQTGYFARTEIPYEHYQCVAAVSAWPDYYRFLYMITVPELVMQK